MECLRDQENGTAQSARGVRAAPGVLKQLSGITEVKAWPKYVRLRASLYLPVGMASPRSPDRIDADESGSELPFALALSQRQKVVLVMDLVESVRLMAANELAARPDRTAASDAHGDHGAGGSSRPRLPEADGFAAPQLARKILEVGRDGLQARPVPHEDPAGTVMNRNPRREYGERPLK